MLLQNCEQVRKAIEDELVASLDDDGSRCAPIGDDELDYRWREGTVTILAEGAVPGKDENGVESGVLAIEATFRVRVELAGLRTVFSNESGEHEIEQI